MHSTNHEHSISLYLFRSLIFFLSRFCSFPHLNTISVLLNLYLSISVLGANVNGIVFLIFNSNSKWLLYINFESCDYVLLVYWFQEVFMFLFLVLCLLVCCVFLFFVCFFWGRVFCFVLLVFFCVFFSLGDFIHRKSDYLWTWQFYFFLPNLFLFYFSS